MNKEKIYKLDSTIHKRLGVKAKALWDEAKRDLFIADLIRNHITRHQTFETTKNDDGNYMFTFYYDYVSKPVDDEAKEYLTNWIKENVDKERLKEWLEDGK